MSSYLYIINIGIILVFITLFFITRRSNKRWSKINDYLGKVTTTVDSIRYGDLSKKINIDHPSYQNVTQSINRMVETLNDRERMIAEYQSELMNQNRLLESVINSLSDGILIINDRFEILRATPKILKWFGIIMQVPYSKFGRNDDSLTDVINVKLKPEEICELIKFDGYELAYHMNKKSWLSIVLNTTGSFN